MESSLNPPEIVKFVPFSSCINPSFWYELNRVKLDDYKLNDDFKEIIGSFNNYSNNDLPPIMNFDYSSFRKNESESVPNNRITNVDGQLKVLNTINEFNLLDKNKLLDEIGQKIWSDILSGKAVDDPNLLIRFCLITFANLKSYIFHYWFSFPAVTFPNKTCHLKKCSNFSEYFDISKTEKFLSNLNSFNQKLENKQIFFAIDHETMDVMSVKEGIENYTVAKRRTLFAFYDTNSLSNYPSWPLRNYLALLCLKCKSNESSLEILAFRDRFSGGVRQIEKSLILTIEKININDSNEKIVTIGWERNEKNQLHPRVVDMSNSMNTEKLAESAVNLNLKLMKWRIAPEINLDLIKNQKCLLLGSGTLGCNIARCLLGWGVETITFVDNSKVSYSNPVRQSLFVFQDSISNSSKDNFKSLLAAENLKQIYPGVNTKGVVLSIPMPGHHIGDNLRCKVKDDVKKLEQLISEHDCIFLLMDTRESRWLPTVIAAAKKKLVINSALGFDSFLVMRHGVKSEQANSEFKPKDLSNQNIPSTHLGCYFCNDIVAPGNSTVDRTLDQQCTVSRPGLSMIASALAVELMVTLLQHPSGISAPSTTNLSHFEKNSNESCLGIVPHQIRGYLHSYSLILPASQAFDKCTACSKQIIDMYNNEGFDFLVKVFNDSSYLEEITGLKELKLALDEAESEFVTELSDSESL